MIDVPVDSIVPLLLVGALTVAMGVVTTRYRRTLNDMVYKNLEASFGKRYAQATAGRQTPFMLGLVGFGILCLGIAMMTFGAIGAYHELF